MVEYMQSRYKSWIGHTNPQCPPSWPCISKELSISLFLDFFSYLVVKSFPDKHLLVFPFLLFFGTYGALSFSLVKLPK
jgi:hypothetical protein